MPVLVYGRDTKLIKQFDNFESKCDKCDSPVLNYYIWQTYYHLYWLPVFPVSKYIVAVCPQCGQTSNQDCTSVGIIFDDKVRAPVYMYFWPIVISVLFIIALIRSIS